MNGFNDGEDDVSVLIDQGQCCNLSLWKGKFLLPKEKNQDEMEARVQKPDEAIMPHESENSIHGPIRRHYEVRWLNTSLEMGKRGVLTWRSRDSCECSGTGGCLVVGSVVGPGSCRSAGSRTRPVNHLVQVRPSSKRTRCRWQ